MADKPIIPVDKKNSKNPFFDKLIKCFSDLSLSLVELLTKFFLSFAILISTVIGVIICLFSETIFYLPLSFVLCATISIFFIWRNQSYSIATHNLESLKRQKKRLDSLYKTLEEQETRLKNIEILEPFEERLARQQLDKQEDSALRSSPIHHTTNTPNKQSVADTEYSNSEKN